uniref:G-protein coupled receptors family 3 profile domain-containing protein n=1 Tax=Eptatretus burgeri TaxID=7764 RepID=A0A8C4WWC8_EPTBU
MRTLAISVLIFLLRFTRSKKELLSLSAPGNITLGGLFPIHSRVANLNADFSSEPHSSACVNFNEDAFFWMYGMIFAIEEVNRKEIFPGITLGYHIFDTCATTSKAVEATLTFLEEIGNREVPAGQIGTSPLVIIGDGDSAQTIPVAQILSPNSIPQISYGATSSLLSNKQRFQTFLRTVPSDVHQTQAIAKLIVHYDWKWIAIIASDDEYGKNGVANLEPMLEKYGVCIEFTLWITKNTFPHSYKTAIEVVQASTVEVIVAFAIDSDIELLMKELASKKINKTWVATEAWISSHLINIPENADLLEGTVGFDLSSYHLDNFNVHLEKYITSNENNFVQEYWRKQFNCEFGSHIGNISSSRPHCTESNVMNNPSVSHLQDSDAGYVFYAYSAVYTVVHAIKEILNCKLGEGLFADGQCADISTIKPWQVMKYLKNVDFNIYGHHFKFNEDGDPYARYNLKNWQRSSNGKIVMKNVGYYFSEHKSTNNSEIKGNLHFTDTLLWKRNSKKPPVAHCVSSCLPGQKKRYQAFTPYCCYLCISCRNGYFSNQADADNCTQCPQDYWSNVNHTQCVRKIEDYLAWNSPLGIIFEIISAFCLCLTIFAAIIFIQHHDTPVVKASNFHICMLLLFALACCFLSVYTFLGKPNEWTCIARQPFFGISFSLALSCVLVKTLQVIVAFQYNNLLSDTLKQLKQLKLFIIVLLTSIEVVLSVTWYFLVSPHPLKNSQIYPGIIYLQCFDDPMYYFSTIIAYIYLLGFICSILAYLVRKLPENFNEAKFIMFGVFIYFLVWTSFIPTYIVTFGKVRVIVEIFAIVASAFGLLVCIFLQKCYIILLKPDINTVEHIRNSTFSHIIKKKNKNVK